MANSYLTPDWLMDSFNQLTKRPEIMTLDAFMNETHKGEMHGDLFGLANRRKVYEYQSKDYGEQKHYGYGDPTDMYNLYLQDMGTTWNDAYIDKYNVNQPTSNVNIFSPEDLQEGVNRGSTSFENYGALSSDDDASPKTAFTPEMFKKLRTEYYQPQIEQERGSLIDKLIGKQKLAKARGGGFAGYGGREKASEAVEGQYRTGVEDIYSGLETQKAASLQDIYDVLAQYEVS